MIIDSPQVESKKFGKREDEDGKGGRGKGSGKGKGGDEDGKDGNSDGPNPKDDMDKDTQVRLLTRLLQCSLFVSFCIRLELDTALADRGTPKFMIFMKCFHLLLPH